MRTLIRSALVLSFVVGALGAGCSSSSDDSATGGSSGSGGRGGAGGSSHAGASGTGHATGGSHSSSAGASGNPGNGEGGAPLEAGGAPNAGAPNAGAPNAGSSNGGTPGASGAAGAGGLPDETAGAGGSVAVKACNSLTPPTATVAVTYNAAAGPATLANGVVQSGTYKLTSYVVYGADSGPAEVHGATATISVSDKTATFEIVYANGATATIAFVQGTPATAEPLSITPQCSTLLSYQSAIGTDIKAVASYQTTDTTFSLYLSNDHILQVFTLQA